jgi:hypothetical protein
MITIQDIDKIESDHHANQKHTCGCGVSLAYELLKERDALQSKLDLMCHDQVKRLEAYEQIYKERDEALARADAYREVAINWKRSETETRTNTIEKIIKSIDAEAQNIISKGLFWTSMSKKPTTEARR